MDMGVWLVMRRMLVDKEDWDEEHPVLGLAKRHVEDGIIVYIV